MKFICVCNSDMNNVPKTKADKLITFKDKLGNEYEDFAVTREYMCSNCGRHLETEERREILPQIMIYTPDKQIKENHFNPAKYKQSIRDALRKQKDIEKGVKAIFYEWLVKCDKEQWVKKYKYNIEELIDFTVNQLVEKFSPQEAIYYLALIDEEMLDKYKHLLKEYV